MNDLDIDVFLPLPPFLVAASICTQQTAFECLSNGRVSKLRFNLKHCPCMREDSFELYNQSMPTVLEER